MWCKEGKSQACRLPGCRSYLAVAINEAPLWLNCSLQDHLHDPYVCQQPGQNILGATKKAQHRGVNLSFKRAQHQKMVFLFYGLQPKRHHVQDRRDFLPLCPSRYQMEPHTCTRTSLVEPSMSQGQTSYCHSHSSVFRHPHLQNTCSLQYLDVVLVQHFPETQR